MNWFLRHNRKCIHFGKYINTAITLNKQMLALNQTSFFLNLFFQVCIVLYFMAELSVRLQRLPTPLYFSKIDVVVRSHMT